MASATRTSDGSSHADRRRAWFRRNGSQRGGQPNQNQNQTRAQATAETQSNQRLSVPTVQRGRASRGRNSTRGRGDSCAHGQSVSRNDQGYWGQQPVNAPPPLLPLLPVETVAQQETQTQLMIEGVSYLQWQWSATHSINGTPFFVETSSILTRTESTGWSSMDYSPSMEANTPASEPPEPWPNSGGHNFVGAQFESESAQLPTKNESSDPTAVFGDNLGSSCSRPVIVSSDGTVNIIEPAGAQNIFGADETEADGIDILSLPLDMSKAHLDWVKAENWLEAIPLGIPRAVTFPLMGINHVNNE